VKKNKVIQNRFGTWMNSLSASTMIRFCCENSSLSLRRTSRNDAIPGDSR
jgi:hypothetical protein